MSSSQTLKPGTRIQGKWNRNNYTIVRLLGEGSNGRVYLARGGKQAYAVKVGFNDLDLQAEINALKALARAKTRAEHFFIEADDAVMSEKHLPFYVMKYVDGSHLQAYIKRSGMDWLYPIGLQLLQQLREMHSKGYIFGDLKRDNVLVSVNGRLQLVDYGGVTPKGRAVRQFTELFDRGYWQAGTRVADESYDLFAFVILCLQSCDPEKELDYSLLPQQRNVETLKEIVKRCPIIPEAKRILTSILHGEMKDTESVYKAWLGMLRSSSGHMLHDPDHIPWLKGLFIASAAALAGTLIWALL